MTRTSLLPCGRTVVGAALLASAWVTQAQHYPPGTEGLKAASLPPPGVYLRDYNEFYFADRLNDAKGHDLNAGLSLFAYAQAPRLIWITKLKFLGANYGLDALVPFIYTDVKATSINYQASKFGLGDIFLEPATLSWHWAKFDAAVGYGVWVPTGKHEPFALENPGKGYWGHMFTLGGTWYPDAKRTWSASILGRYEVNAGHDARGITPGDTLTIEGGVGKAFSKSFELGLIGYCQQQLTDNQGPATTSDLAQVWGLGPEVTTVWKQVGAAVSLRYIRELHAEDPLNRPQGNTVTLTLTKRF